MAQLAKKLDMSTHMYLHWAWNDDKSTCTCILQHTFEQIST